MNRFFAVLIASLSLFLGACQDASVGSKTYPDAVVALHQVDPAYRQYFEAQNGSNYSLADQRAAYLKAAQTARGPMPQYVSSSAGNGHRKRGAAPRYAGKGKGKAAVKGGSKGGAKGGAKNSGAKKPVKSSGSKKRR